MTTLTFQNTTLSVINQNNQTFLTGRDLGIALGYSDADRSVRRLYTANADEFTAGMTDLVEVRTAGGKQQVRIFSLRGAHLIAMFARTKVAKDFRKWVLDILDRETQQPKQLALPEPVTYTASFTADEIHNLVWLLLSHRNMNNLLGELRKPLEAIGSNFFPAVHSHHFEYKRIAEQCQPLLAELIEPFKATNPIAYERVKAQLS